MADSPLSSVKLRLVESIDDLMDMKRWAGERRETPMGVDTESGGLSPWHTRLRTIQLGDKNYGWCVPWEQWGGGAMEILNTYEGEFTWHNLPHDAKFMQVKTGWDVPWHRCHDTLIGARIQEPGRPAGLKPLVSKLVDKTALAGQKALDDGMKAQGWTWDTVPLKFDPYWIYAAFDPVLNCHLYEKIIPDVQQRFGLVYDLEMAVLRIATKMMIKGAQLDPLYIETEREKLLTFSQEARLWLKVTYGITSPLSAGQISRALAELGVEINVFTDAGAPKMDKDTLEKYQAVGNSRARELIQYVLAVRHADKLRGTYLDNFMEMADEHGVLHASINTLAARTSRMSMSDPNLQNLPRDDKMIRGSVVPRPGNVLVTCDLDQVEARFGAHFSEDPGLVEAFDLADNGGTDFFCTVASGIYGDTITNKKDPRRQPTKNVFYGSLYGAGAKKMAETAGITFEQMDPVKRAFDAAYPGLKASLDRVYREAMERDKPYIVTPFGRHIPLDRDRAYTQGLNSLIQGHAAEYFKVSLTRMEAADLDEFLLLPVHDEVVADVPEDMAEEVARAIAECMSDASTYRVKISAGADILKDRWRKT